MIEKPTIDLDERIFTVSDVKRLYIKMRRALLKWALFGACCAFLYVGVLRVPKYKIEATFKEEVERGGGGGGENLLKEMLGGMSGAQQPEVIGVMQSYQLLKPLTEKLGLQATISGNSKWILSKVVKRLKESLFAEVGTPLPDVDTFVFEDLFYEGDEPVQLSVCFTDLDHYSVFSSNRKEELCQNVLGAEVRVQEAKFTIKKVPDNLKIGYFYDLKINPWISVAKSIKSQLEIISDKKNKSFYHISTLTRDRHFGKRLVNELMNQYKCYLKREHDQMNQEQLGYLEGKQGQIYGQMEKVFDEHVAYLTENLEKNGLAGMVEETASLAEHHQAMLKKLRAIDIDLARIDQIAKGGSSVSLLKEGRFIEDIYRSSTQIQELKRQRDLFEVSLCKNLDYSIGGKKEGLQELRNQRYAVEKLLQELSVGFVISSCDVNLSSPLESGLYLWAQSIENPEEKSDLVEHLNNYVRILNVREKTLQESSFGGDQMPIELQSIDLPTARALFVEYNAKLDGIEGSMRLFSQFQNEIQHPDFELGSLSSILTDPFSQKLIAEASEIGVRLKNEKYHSLKEGNRWQEDIDLHKKILIDHLKHLHKTASLNASLIREKIMSLQKVCVDCINQQISVLNEQAQDQMNETRHNLTAEKKLLEEKMKEIRALSVALPEKWRLEKWLELKSGMVIKMMETITQVVESKTLSHHLYRVGSRPLDAALLPLSPQSPRLFVMSFLAAFLLPFGLFFFSLIKQILKGFPISSEKLQALRLPTLGSISGFCDGPTVETPSGPDMELLRGIALFSEGGKVVGLLGGKGPDYSYALCENLSRMSIRSIVVRCDFLSKFQKEDCPGILQMFNNEIKDVPIRKGNGFDYITSGGYSPFGTEIIQSQCFANLVSDLKGKYDRVFLLIRTSLSCAESIATLRHCEKAAVSVSEEKTEELTPFINWGYDANRCRLTFITHS